MKLFIFFAVIFLLSLNFLLQQIQKDAMYNVYTNIPFYKFSLWNDHLKVI